MKKDTINLDVKKTEDKKRYKDNIITALYLNGIILKKIKGILSRHRVPTQAQIEEDLNQIVFLELSKKPEDVIIEMYEDDPSRLVGLCVRIAVLKGVAKNKNSLYPKHNFCDSLTYMSNLPHQRNNGDTEFFLEMQVDEATDKTAEEIDYEEQMSVTQYLTEESINTLDEYIESISNKHQTYQQKFWKKETNKLKHIKLIHEILNQQTKKMINIEALIEIERVLPLIKEYHRTRKAGHLEASDILEIKRIWDAYINPAAKLNTGCTTCIKDAMDIMESFYTAHKRRENTTETIVTEEIQNSTEENPVKITFENKPKTITQKKKPTKRR